MKTRRVGISDLAGKVGRKKFIADYWRENKPLVSHGSIKRFAEIVGIPELNSVRALIEAWPAQDDVSLFPPPKAGVFLKSAPARDAYSLYKGGYTLYFKNLERHIRSLRPILRRLEYELGLLPGDMFFEAFASLKGSGTKAHFDPYPGFNLQISGTKRWEFAKNEHIEWPHFHYAVTPVNEQPRVPHAKNPLPTKMPPVSLKTIARPGTLVYVPHGYWHRTQADAESFAIIISIAPKRWGDVVVDFVSQQLASRPVARKLAVNFNSRGAAKEETEILENIVVEIQSILKATEPGELADRLRSSFRKTYVIREGIRLSLVSGPKADGTNLEVFAGKRRHRHQVDPELAPVVRWIAGQKGKFSMSQALSQLNVGPAEARKCFDVLASAGLIVDGDLERSDG